MRFGELAYLKSLESLYLDGVQISGDGLAQIGGLSHLEESQLIASHWG